MLEEINLENVFVIDIETVPQEEHFQNLSPLLQQLWTDKTQYIRKELHSAEDFYERAGIWAEFGKIICISVGFYHLKKHEMHLRISSFYGNDEKEVLTQFVTLLGKQSKKLLLCAHNGKEFDFPFLCRRMLINGLPIPHQLQISGKKPWEINHIDTMELWKFGDYKHYTSLNLLATIFNIPTSKDDIDGSMVKEVYYKEKNLERIVTYCQKDVITTAQILLRFKGSDTIKEENITLVK
ncbi:3'-5' exonuclease [Pedobacter montanisoli]|uniref:3'-5' exonuclease n=1 Tax=Pedobacter montanisoli TaxID=2923277 RepID=A0ABS9ZZ34_9SPHI|nr:3'-5' exonuclease [Pedobacter montanisoli]MCJ0743560.1 3'-5' exonuclease [Pedobacter montanisoli]